MQPCCSQSCIPCRVCVEGVRPPGSRMPSLLLSQAVSPRWQSYTQAFCRVTIPSTPPCAAHSLTLAFRRHCGQSACKSHTSSTRRCLARWSRKACRRHKGSRSETMHHRARYLAKVHTVVPCKSYFSFCIICTNVTPSSQDSAPGHCSRNIEFESPALQSSTTSQCAQLAQP